MINKHIFIPLKVDCIILSEGSSVRPSKYDNFNGADFGVGIALEELCGLTSGFFDVLTTILKNVHRVC